MIVPTGAKRTVYPESRKRRHQSVSSPKKKLAEEEERLVEHAHGADRIRTGKEVAAGNDVDVALAVALPTIHPVALCRGKAANLEKAAR